jgi:hypothetical protein
LYESSGIDLVESNLINKNPFLIYGFLLESIYLMCEYLLLNSSN